MGFSQSAKSKWIIYFCSVLYLRAQKRNTVGSKFGQVLYHFIHHFEKNTALARLYIELNTYYLNKVQFLVNYNTKCNGEELPDFYGYMK